MVNLVRSCSALLSFCFLFDFRWHDLAFHCFPFVFRTFPRFSSEFRSPSFFPLTSCLLFRVLFCGFWFFLLGTISLRCSNSLFCTQLSSPSLSSMFLLFFSTQPSLFLRSSPFCRYSDRFSHCSLSMLSATSCFPLFVSCTCNWSQCPFLCPWSSPVGSLFLQSC